MELPYPEVETRIEYHSPPPRPAPPVDSGFVPPVPLDLEQAELTESLVEDLILKQIYTHGQIIGRDLAKALGFRFSVIASCVDSMKRKRVIESKGSLGYGDVSAVFGISDAGRTRVKEGLEHNQYVGRAPVPISQYTTAVRQQRLKSGWLTRAALKEAYKGMIVSQEILAQIGPAVNSGKSFLIYGKPGNGKTFLAEALFNLNSTPIYVPYAIQYQGMIVKVFDPVYHHPIERAEEMASSISAEPLYDARWVRCRRPFIVTGGELTIGMLDLGFNPSSKVYDAPFQMKANNGIYLIDDFGRQKASPAEVLNRWIVPMDRKVDYLTFQTGGKVEAPFETFLIFSTNLQPEQLGDEAFLRRLQYKMFLQSPNRDEYIDIFISYAKSQGLECSEDLVSRIVEKHYTQPCRRMRRCQPRDVISHAIDLMNFEELPRELTEEVYERAFHTCFVSDGIVDD